MTWKQKAVLNYLAKTPTITISEAVSLCGRDVYDNHAKHTGKLLSRMVKRGQIVRQKPGIFALP